MLSEISQRTTNTVCFPFFLSCSTLNVSTSLTPFTFFAEVFPSPQLYPDHSIKTVNLTLPSVLLMPLPA